MAHARLRDRKTGSILEGVADWLCSGLQLRSCRFDSDLPLIPSLGSCTTVPWYAVSRDISLPTMPILELCLATLDEVGKIVASAQISKHKRFF